MLAFLIDAYDEEDLGEGSPTSARSCALHPRLAPVKVAVLPLVKKDGQPELAREVQAQLKPLMQTEYDEGGSIGKRYRRQDEIGTPWCVTIDHQSLEDRTVTVRDRDSLAQERVAIDDLAGLLAGRLAQPWTSPKLGRGVVERRHARVRDRPDHPARRDAPRRGGPRPAGLRAARRGERVGDTDADGVFTVTVEADDLDDALTIVWDGVAASGTDDHLLFLEHPDLPEHWRSKSAASRGPARARC